MAFDVLANPAWTTRLRIRDEGGEPMRGAERRIQGKVAAKGFGKSMGERVVYVDVAALGEGVEHAWVGIDRVVVMVRR